MKTMLVLSVVGILSGCAHAPAGSCKVVETKNDAIDGPQRSVYVALSRQSWAALRLVERNGKHTLTVVAALGAESLERASVGDVGFFAVGGRVIELHLTKAASPIRETTLQHYVVTRWLLEYDVPEDAAALFVEGALVAWKTNVGALPLRLEIPRDAQQRLQRGFGCMLQTARVASAR